MQPRTIGGYEWQSAQKVTEYLDREKEPERESEFTEAHQQMLDMLSQLAELEAQLSQQRLRRGARLERYREAYFEALFDELGE